jgi:preprotein translocase subunit YajC
MDFSQILIDLFIIGLFAIAVYSFSVLPRQREFRRRQKLVSRLKPGAEVITYGGLVGTVKRVEAEKGMVTLEIAKGVEARFVAQAISAEYDANAIGDSAKRASK